MLQAFIIDDDKYAVEATYQMFPWQEIGIGKIKKIYTTTNLIEQILYEKPHIVFIDIEIGTVSGLDIISKCKEQGSNSLFIIISGHDNFSYAHAAVNLGVIHYLLKPIDPDDIQLVVKKLKKNLLPLHENYEKETSDKFSGEKSLWSCLLDYIEKNYMKKLLVQDICSDLYISPSTFYSTFKTHAKVSFVDYLTSFRLEKAKQLLISSSKSIPEISNLVGIQDQYYFNKIFKKHTGMTAAEYRQQHTEVK